MFVCCTETEAKQRLDKLQNLKNLVEEIEDKITIPCALVACPRCAPLAAPEVKEMAAVSNPPDVMVCYKTEHVEKKKTKKVVKPRVRKRAKSRELRAGILYAGCDCEKRYGLQDDCRRTECHGSPECLTKPEPICGPSEFSNGKHLGKKYKYSFGRSGNDEDDEGNGKVTVCYNCYPAKVTC